MVLPSKPALVRAKTEPRPHSAYTKAEKDHVQVVKSLCKTYRATLTKLTYVFGSLHDELQESSKASSISEAIRAGKRDEMMEKISQELAGGVEEILRTKDLSLRAGVLRDLRARFVVKAPPAKVDAEVQTTQPRERKQKASKEQGNGEEPVVEPKPEAAADGGSEETPLEEGTPRKLHRAFSFADRQIAWEVKKLAKIQAEREEKERREKESSPAVPTTRKAVPNLYAHVQSAIKLQRKEEETGKLQEAAATIEQERRARAAIEGKAAELTAELSAVQGKCAFLSEERDAATHELGQAKGRMREVEGKLEALRRQAEQEAQSHSDVLEIRDAFGERGLEEWAPFPGKRVFQVTKTEAFDGRISAEFRQKDSESGERGISLLMGRNADTMTTEVQCVLFDPKYLSDVQAARWWEANRRRFEKRAEQVRLLAAAAARINANVSAKVSDCAAKWKARTAEAAEVAEIQQEITVEPKPARGRSASRRAAAIAAAEVEALNKLLDGERPRSPARPTAPSLAAVFSTGSVVVAAKA